MSVGGGPAYALRTGRRHLPYTWRTLEPRWWTGPRLAQAIACDHRPEGPDPVEPGTIRTKRRGPPAAAHALTRWAHSGSRGGHGRGRTMSGTEGYPPPGSGWP